MAMIRSKPSFDAKWLTLHEQNFGSDICIFQSSYFYSVIFLDTEFLKGYEITYPIPNFVLTNYIVSYQIMIRNMLYLVNDCHRYNFHRNIFIPVPHFVYQIGKDSNLTWI